MNMRKLMQTTAMAAILLTSGVAMSAPMYAITDFGTMVAGFSSVRVYGVNNSSQQTDAASPP